MVTVNDVTLQTYKPGETTPHLTIPGQALSGPVEIKRRVQEWKDIGSLEFRANGEQYAGELTSGDKVVFEAVLADRQSSTGSFGYASFGGGSFGGTSKAMHNVLWTGFSHVPTFESTGARLIDASLELSDFGFQILSDRRAYMEYIDKPIGDIARSLIEEFAPELDASGIEDVGQTYTRTYDGLNLMDAFLELATVGRCILSSEDSTIVLKPISELADAFILQTSDFGTIKRSGDDADMITDIRIDGSEDTKLDEEQAVRDGYQSVTTDSRIIHELDPKKSRIDHVEVWTRTTGSGDGVKVRIQQADSGNTGPINVSDETLDIQSRRLAAEFLDDDGFTTFLLPRETLPPNPWLIIEGDGSTGQDIGVDTTTGAPTYRSHYPFPIAVRAEDDDAEAEYRKRMDRRKRDDLSSFQAGRDLATSILERNNQPVEQVTFDAWSLRAHTVSPATVLHVNQPEIDAQGRYIVSEVQHKYDPETVHLATNVTAQHLDTI